MSRRNNLDVNNNLYDSVTIKTIADSTSPESNDKLVGVHPGPESSGAIRNSKGCTVEHAAPKSNQLSKKNLQKASKREFQGISPINDVVELPQIVDDVEITKKRARIQQYLMENEGDFWSNQTDYQSTDDEEQPPPIPTIELSKPPSEKIPPPIPEIPWMWWTVGIVGGLGVIGLSWYCLLNDNTIPQLSPNFFSPHPKKTLCKK